MQRTLKCLWLAGWLCLLGACLAACQNAPRSGPLRFRITLAREMPRAATAGRLLVFISASMQPSQSLAVGFIPGDTWMAAMEVAQLAPGQTIEFNPDLQAFPQPFSQAKRGTYQVMALLDTDFATSKHCADFAIKLAAWREPDLAIEAAQLCADTDNKLAAFTAILRMYYQLTAIGGPGPNLYIAGEVANNQFKIAGGQAGLKVSWQVTGIRQDAWANAYRIPVEEAKPEPERGRYLHPAVHGQPEEKAVDWARRLGNDRKK